MTSSPSSPSAPAAVNTSLIYLNGDWVPKDQAVISVFDHGLLYGDGVFEGIRAYNGRVFKLTEHLERLYRSARAILLGIPLSLEEMRQVVLTAFRKNNLRDGYVRLVVTRGMGDLGLDPRKCPRPTVFVIADKITLYSPEAYARGMEVAVVATRRNPPQSVNPSIKSLNYLNNILAKIEATRLGVMEAILLNADGFVAECTGDNVFYTRQGQLVTPPASAGALEGITRNCVMGLAQSQGILVSEKLFTTYELYTADEVFLTGTAAEVIPVVKVDGRTVGDGQVGPLTRRLIEAFHALTQVEGDPL